METQTWFPPVCVVSVMGGLNEGTMATACSLCMERAQLGTVVPANSLVPERAAPPTLTLKPDNSLPP